MIEKLSILLFGIFEMNLFFNVLAFVVFAVLPFYLVFRMDVLGSYIVKMFPCTNAELFLNYRRWKRRIHRNKTGRKYWLTRRNKIVVKRTKRSLVNALVFSLFSYALFLHGSSFFLPLTMVYLILLFLILLIAEIDRKFCLIPDLLSFPAMLIVFLLVGLKQYYIDTFSFESVANESILMQSLLNSTAPSVLNSALTALYAYFICTFVTILTFKKYPDGFGGGDLKLLIFLGAFVGMSNFPALIVLSVVYFGIASWLLKKRYLPYAPFALLSLLSVFGYFLFV